jgi:hypothetical protein
MGTLCGQHLQVIQFSGHFRFGNSIKKLDSWLSTGAHFLGRAEAHDVALVNQEHPVGDQKCARKLMVSEQLNSL